MDRVLGCIVGGAIGDAAASAFEGVDSPDGSDWLEREWQITDDTQLTLATCEAICGGKVEPALIASSLLAWFRARRILRMGSSTLKALRDLDAGGHWALAGRLGERAAGNGAAMRIAPLAFCTDPSTSPGRQLIRDVCRITHHNEEAYVGALAVVLAIRSPLSLSELAGLLPDSVVRDRLLSLDALSIAEAALQTGTSGFVGDSVPLALFAARAVARIGFAEMLGQIIAVGGDTDTIASMAGQVAGAALGLSGLPGHLVELLPEREMILDVAREFAARLAQGRVR